MVHYLIIQLLESRKFILFHFQLTGLELWVCWFVPLVPMGLERRTYRCVHYNHLYLLHYQALELCLLHQVVHQVELMIIHPYELQNLIWLMCRGSLAWQPILWPSFFLLHAISRKHTLSSDLLQDGQLLHRITNDHTSSSWYVFGVLLLLSSQSYPYSWRWRHPWKCQSCFLLFFPPNYTYQTDNCLAFHFENHPINY